MKTNKSFTKRLRVSKNGKIIARVPGQNHFNAKEGRRRQMQRRRNVALNIPMTAKDHARYLPGKGSKNS